MRFTVMSQACRRYRQRMGEKRMQLLLETSLSVAVNTGALKPDDTRQIIVDTTVQPKNAAFPADAKLTHRAEEQLVRLDQKTRFVFAPKLYEIIQIIVYSVSTLCSCQTV